MNDLGGGGRARLGGLALLVAALTAGYYAAGLAAVPFHPDESTQIHMSQDFAAVFLEAAPARLAWRPAETVTPETRYRWLDAPLPRYLIGLSGWLAGFRPADLNADWVWAADWQTNLAQGRMPRPELLWASRLPAALLGALTAALVLLIGAAARHWGVGLAAAGLTALHPLMQLHARRAMAEGPLLFTSALTMAAGLAAARWLDRRPTLANWRCLAAGAGLGLLAGLAFASKQSAVAVGLAAWLPAALAILQKPAPRRARLGALAAWTTAALAAASLVTLALNPVLWAAPLATLPAMWAARWDLARAQAQTVGALLPDQDLLTAAARLRAGLLNVYLRPPAVWDVPLENQLGLLEPQARTYLAAPLHQTHLLAGALLAGLTAAGLAFSGLRLGRDRLGPATRGEQTVWAWGLASLAFIVLAVGIDWQRYFVPLLPAACLFAALGLDGLAAPLARRLIHARAD